MNTIKLMHGTDHIIENPSFLMGNPKNDYGKGFLYNYSAKVIVELDKRGYKIKTFENFDNYFQKMVENKYFKNHDFNNEFAEHNNEYLLICFFNLLEKYRRGQKDFDKATFNKLYDFVNTKFDSPYSLYACCRYLLAWIPLRKANKCW